MLSHNGASILTVDFKPFGAPLECPSSIVLLNFDPRFPIKRDLTVRVIWFTPINGDFLASFFPIFRPPSFSKKVFSDLFSSLSILSSCHISTLRGSSAVLTKCCKAVHPPLHLSPYGGLLSPRQKRQCKTS